MVCVKICVGVVTQTLSTWFACMIEQIANLDLSKKAAQDFTALSSGLVAITIGFR